MPTRVWLSPTARLSYRTSDSPVALVEAPSTVLHDRLTKLQQGDSSRHTRLEAACRVLIVWEQGFLIIDDTGLAKPFATAMEGLAGVLSSQARRPVYGCSLVLLVWTDGHFR
jgi:hypothetical protein